MRQWSFPIGHRTQPGAVAFDESGNRLWLATETGDLVTFRLYDQATQVLGGGYLDPVAVLPQGDGLKVAVVERAGTVLLAARAVAGRQDARVVAALGRTITGAAPLPDTAGVLVVGDGVAMTVDLSDGSVTTLTSGLVKPSAVMIDEQRRRAVVVDARPEGARLELVDLDSGVITTYGGTPLNDAVAIAAAPQGTDGVFVAAGPGGALTLIRLDVGVEESGPDLGGPVRGLARWGSLVLLVTDTGIVAHEWGLQPGPMEVSTPIGPVYTGGYFRATAVLDEPGLTPEDVEFLIEEGAGAGFVSAGIEPPEPDGRWPIVVGAGQVPGEYHLVVRRITGGQELARRRFRVTGHWPDDKRGPAVVVTGKAPVAVPRAWGGSTTTTPIPASMDWRVAIVLVNTRDQRFTTASAQQAQADYSRFLITDARSAMRFFEEVSFGKTTVSWVRNEVFGPIDLPFNWGDYLKPRGGAWDGWVLWNFFWDECARAFSDYLEVEEFNHHPTWAAQTVDSIDVIVFVFPTYDPGDPTLPTDDDPARFVWGKANIDNPPWLRPRLPRPFGHFSKIVPAITMPNRLSPGLPTPWDMAEVLTHELGHSLGLRDLYDKGYPAEVVMDRIMDELDMMGSNTTKWPNFSLAHRIRLGWIDPAWMKTFNFTLNPVGGTVTLHALQTLSSGWTPPAGDHCAGIEIPILGSDNYYFEYRTMQLGQVGDQQLASSARGATRVVLGTHTNFDPAATPDRPHILLLHKDLDADGPILIAAGEDYEETDTSGNGSPHDFRLVLDNTPIDNTTQVTVQYTPAQRPQLRIEPPPGAGDWKSPDINVTGPAGRNVLAAGRNHTIEITVHNRGNWPAKNVKIRVAWLPFTTAPGPWNQLPVQPAPQNIPAHGKVVYRASWDVPKMTLDGVDVWHFCVRADVTAYDDPHDAHDEITVFDNWAQSNFDRAFLWFGSPSARRRTGVTITNTLAHPATFRTAVNQDSAHFRTYIGNAWLRLEPDEVHVTEFMYESLAGDPVHGSAFQEAFDQNEGLSNNASLTTSVIGPGDSCGVGHQWWGGQLNIIAAYATRIENLRMNSDGVFGTVIGTRNSIDQTLSHGEVNVVFWLADEPEETTASGSWLDDLFWVAPPEHIQEAAWQGREVYGEAFYVSPAVWASCRSGPHRLTLGP